MQPGGIKEVGAAMLERFKVMGAVLAAPAEFTISDIVAASKVRENTVRTVLGRNAIKPISTRATGKPGGKLWIYRLTPAERDRLRGEFADGFSALQTAESSGVANGSPLRPPLGLLAAEEALGADWTAARSTHEKRSVLERARLDLDLARAEMAELQGHDSDWLEQLNGRLQNAHSLFEAKQQLVNILLSPRAAAPLQELAPAAAQSASTPAYRAAETLPARSRAGAIRALVPLEAAAAGRDDLVLVSNLIGPPQGEPVHEGLAAAFLPAVKTGAIWFGASNRQGTSTSDYATRLEPLGAGALATVDLPPPHYRGFHEGFANSVLWPAFHSREDLIRVDSTDYASYRAANTYMASALLRLPKPNATVWVQDHHFLPLGHELRQQGFVRPIGFFLHTPFPIRAMASVPWHRELIQSMLAYDLIGFQTDSDRENFKNYLKQELHVSLDGDLCFWNERVTRLATFPVGIDVRTLAQQADEAAGAPEMRRLLSTLNGQKLAIGVECLDYSKGLPNRFRAFDRMFDLHPDIKGAVNLLQIAVPGRANGQVNKNLQTELAGMVGDINARHADVDWTPIRYLNKPFRHAVLAGFYRTAHVGLVTSFHDGMSLVAKEYVAAQDPSNPGVLVLSEFAGAAKELDAAVLVNPYDVEGMAHSIYKALDMPVEERQQRWSTMMDRLKEADLDGWFSGFVKTLGNSPTGANVSFQTPTASGSTAASALN